MPAACLYTQQSFLDKNPETAQALANAIVRADKWIQGAGAGDIIKAVPESYLLGDRAVYVDAFLAAKGALSPDGMFPEAGRRDGAARARQHRSRDRQRQDRPGGDLHQRLRQARERQVPEGLTPRVDAPPRRRATRPTSSRPRADRHRQSERAGRAVMHWLRRSRSASTMRPRRPGAADRSAGVRLTNAISDGRPRAASSLTRRSTSVRRGAMQAADDSAGAATLAIGSGEHGAGGRQDEQAK